MTVFGVFLIAAAAVWYFSFQMKETYGKKTLL